MNSLVYVNSLRRRLIGSALVKVDVTALMFSYTGSWTDTTMTIDGQLYRVLQLKSGGVLTLDPLMVRHRVPFDAWLVRQGETGDPGDDYVGHYGSGYCYSCGQSYSYGVGNSGYNGDAGGWSFYYGNISSMESLTVYMNYNETSLYNSSRSLFLQVTNTSRVGNAWFTLPYGNNGQGGFGGSGGYEDGSCPDHTGFWIPASEGSVGTAGIVVIRIPI